MPTSLFASSKHKNPLFGTAVFQSHSEFSSDRNSISKEFPLLFCTSLRGIFYSTVLAEIWRHSTPSKTECAGFLFCFVFCHMQIKTPRMAINSFCILTTLTLKHYIFTFPSELCQLVTSHKYLLPSFSQLYSFLHFSWPAFKSWLIFFISALCGKDLPNSLVGVDVDVCPWKWRFCQRLKQLCF